MPRVYTRTKRRKALGASSQKHRYWKGNTPKRERLKSFETEAKARAWAKEQGLDEQAYELRALKTKWQWKRKNPRYD